MALSPHNAPFIKHQFNQPRVGALSLLYNPVLLCFQICVAFWLHVRVHFSVTPLLLDNQPADGECWPLIFNNTAVNVDKIIAVFVVLVGRLQHVPSVHLPRTVCHCRSYSSIKSPSICISGYIFVGLIWSNETESSWCVHIVYILYQLLMFLTVLQSEGER